METRWRFLSPDQCKDARTLVTTGVALTGDPEAGIGVFRQFTDDDTIL